MPAVPVLVHMDAAWSICLAFFLDSVEAISGSLASRRRYHDVSHAFFSDPSRNPDSYSSTEVLTFLARKSRSRRNPGATVTAGTRNNRLMVLSSFYKFAASYEVNGTPLLQSKPPTYGIKYAKFNPSPHALSADELERFFAVIPKHTIKGVRDRAIFLTFFWSGRRRSEIARLRWRDIEQAIVVEPGGIRRPGVLYRYISKGHSRETQIAEMPLLAWQAIMRYLDQSGRANKMMPDSPLFASVRHDQHEQQLTGDYLNDQFKHYAAQAGLDPLYSLHSLRHSAARERYSAGSSIADVQVFLGHSSIGTTDLYLKRLSGVADTGAALLEARFGKL